MEYSIIRIRTWSSHPSPLRPRVCPWEVEEQFGLRFSLATGEIILGLFLVPCWPENTSPQSMGVRMASDQATQPVDGKRDK